MIIDIIFFSLSSSCLTLYNSFINFIYSINKKFFSQRGLFNREEFIIEITNKLFIVINNNNSNNGS